MKDLIRKFEKKQVSGKAMRVYYAIKSLENDGFDKPNLQQIADYIGDHGQHREQAICNAKRKLKEAGLLLDCVEKTSEPLNSGIYCLRTKSAIYIGQSKRLLQRRNQHIRSIESGLHRYIKSDEDCKFEILETCKISELLIKEQLWANKLHSGGENILNKENFMFISENK